MYYQTKNVKTNVVDLDHKFKGEITRKRNQQFPIGQHNKIRVGEIKTIYNSL